MSNVKIRDFPTGEITDNDDYFALATASGSTVKIPYSALATVILQSSLLSGSNITIVDATTQDGLKRFMISAGASTEWYYGSTQPSSANSGDYWIDTTTGNNLAVYQYNNSQWNTTGIYLKGTDGADGLAATIQIGTVSTGAAGTNVIIENSGTSSAAVFDFTIPRGADGVDGTNGVNGYSISATASEITGGHKLIISSTDPASSDVSFDVMDGTEVIQTTSDNRTITLLANNWTGVSAPYTQTVTVTGMTANTVPIIGLVPSDTIADAIEEVKQWGHINEAESDVNSIMFVCYNTKPTIDLVANIKVV